jgi:conjugal transfer pilus assembly protein TraB
MQAFDRIKKVWESLSPKHKKASIISALCLAIIIGSYFLYKSKEPASRNAREEKNSRTLALDPRLLEKSLYEELRGEITQRDRMITDLKMDVEEIKQDKTLLHQQVAAQEAQRVGEVSIPPPPPAMPAEAQPAPSLYRIPPPPRKAGEDGPKKVVAGEIEVVSNESAKREEGSGVKKNESKDPIYLPPSFMEATLLSGLDAPVLKEAKSNPVPVLLRIKDLAVLPNRLKADLKGCFVIAEGHGDLADERAHLRLVSLSCIAKNGQAVIDQKIKGFVVDEDGKIGLKGHVVSRMGSTIARVALAGFFGGVGEGLAAASTAQSISPLGATQTIDTDDIAKAAVGKGIASGFGELQRFYLELARQTMPVIEVGATKTITLVVSEGVELKIKNYCVGGNENCG